MSYEDTWRHTQSVSYKAAKALDTYWETWDQSLAMQRYEALIRDWHYQEVLRRFWAYELDRYFVRKMRGLS